MYVRLRRPEFTAAAKPAERDFGTADLIDVVSHPPGFRRPNGQRRRSIWLEHDGQHLSSIVVIRRLAGRREWIGLAVQRRRT